MSSGKFAALLAILASLCPALRAEERPFPTVRIATPKGGVSSERAVTVTGTIADPAISRATIVVNGSANPFDVSNGSFSYLLILAPGDNLIQVVAENETGVGRDAVAIHSVVPKRDVKVVMTWDTPTDIDLHVIDPAGEECFYSSPQSKIGGQLDHDDTDGFGPETFLLSNAIDGTYIVKTKYYGGEGGQTLVVISVILFEGTPDEHREEYRRLLTSEGEFVEVCAFHVGG
ncbi:MAG: DUF2135 domain-containing protein [Planctomycetes bacterium]|nr:DUF2135 domain-containing protein [Planctomycetota bacterium]